ncbi:MAG: hypothetical protein GC192_02155 [Bacteroidetes bacterium]|nr:hypothetical protein [Bacteroidota bacterium]
MKKFILYILVVLLSTSISLELILKVFHLSGHTVPTAIIENDKLLKPGTENIWVRGGLGEIRSHYKINDQGWNSILDYSDIDSNKIYVAIIGDSYIQGFQSNVEESIGRQLELQMNNKVTVHEYGRDGANINDYVQVYEKYIRGKYGYAFMLITDKDLIANKPSFMGVKKPLNESFIRKLYNNIALIRYLNINHGLGLKLTELFSGFPTVSSQIESKAKNEKLTQNSQGKINQDALSRLNSDIIILYEKGKLNEKFISSTANPTVEVKHILTPKDCGFDSHWNVNGRKNCAKAIKDYIESLENGK